MQISKRKMSVEFVKEFTEPIYDVNIDLSSVSMKTTIIEEHREDVKVVFEGNKDLVSNVVFDIVDKCLNINVISRVSTGVRSSAVVIHSVFTTENKLSIYLPIHFKNYSIVGKESSLRINNLIADSLDVKFEQGSVKVKYCNFSSNLSINTDKSVVSIKAIESEGDVSIVNTSGVTKFRDIDCSGDISLNSEMGTVHAKNVKTRADFATSTRSGSIDLDDVYANKVDIYAKSGVVNYFNGNFNKEFEVNIDVLNGVVRTNVKREEIH